MPDDRDWLAIPKLLKPFRWRVRPPHHHWADDQQPMPRRTIVDPLRTPFKIMIKPNAVGIRDEQLRVDRLTLVRMLVEPLANLLERLAPIDIAVTDDRLGPVPGKVDVA